MTVTVNGVAPTPTQKQDFRDVFEIPSDTELSAAIVSERSASATLSNKTLTSPVINSPTGITKSDVGLGNVDNTSDANKPVSTAQQAALDLKLNAANPSYTGTLTGGTGVVNLGSGQFVKDASGNVVIGGTFADAPGAVTIQGDGTIRAILNSGQASASVFGAISGVSNGYAISNDASNNITYAWNGSAGEWMRLSAGNFGIGTPSPTYKIDTRGPAGTGWQIYEESTGTNKRLIVTQEATTVRYNATYSTAGNAHTWANGGADNMMLDSSGNLGLGVTPSPWTGRVAFQAYTASIASPPGVPGIGEFSTNRYVQSGVDRYMLSAAAAVYQQNEGSHRWYTAPSGTTGNPISFTQAMTLASNGEWNIDGSGGRVTLTPGGASNTINSTTTLFGAFNTLKYRASAHEWVNSAGTVIGQFDTSGSLLVGTTIAGYQPTNAISVEGPQGYLVVNHASGAPSGSLYMAFGHNAAGVGSITQNGTTGVLYNTASDARLKENIAAAENGSALIDQLQVRKFDWKADGSHQRYGFVAQELDAVYPEAVSKPADPQQMMGVDYSKLVPLLVQEVQSLRTRLAILEAKQ